MAVARNVSSVVDENQSESSYRDDFESSYTQSEGQFQQYDTSFASSKMSASKTFKPVKNGSEPLDEHDILQQEARHWHQKIQAKLKRGDHSAA